MRETSIDAPQAGEQQKRSSPTETKPLSRLLLLKSCVSALEAVYREAYTALRHRALLPSRSWPFRVRFFPYAGLTSTIYQRPDHNDVRLADLLQGAPLAVHYSLACILLSKLDRRLHITRAERAAYETWSRMPSVVGAHQAARRTRGAKRLDPPWGHVHDLTLLFHRLNRAYFRGLLPCIALGWSRHRSRTLWGHHDDAHSAIVINRMLDSPRVPSYVVESILFHELLHHKFGPQFGPTGRRVLHSRAMREEEKRYAQYEPAQRFLRDVADRRIRL